MRKEKIRKRKRQKRTEESTWVRYQHVGAEHTPTTDHEISRVFHLIRTDWHNWLRLLVGSSSVVKRQLALKHSSLQLRCDGKKTLFYIKHPVFSVLRHENRLPCAHKCYADTEHCSTSGEVSVTYPPGTTACVGCDDRLALTSCSSCVLLSRGRGRSNTLA